MAEDFSRRTALGCRRCSKAGRHFRGQVRWPSRGVLRLGPCLALGALSYSVAVIPAHRQPLCEQMETIQTLSIPSTSDLNAVQIHLSGRSTLAHSPCVTPRIAVRHLEGLRGTRREKCGKREKEAETMSIGMRGGADPVRLPRAVVTDHGSVEGRASPNTQQSHGTIGKRESAPALGRAALTSPGGKNELNAGPGRAPRPGVGGMLVRSVKGAQNLRQGCAFSRSPRNQQ